MAAPIKSRNVVSKDSLRRLMKEKTSGSKSSSARIDHPCAKYNALEQLTCIVCKSVVKNERLWNAHIMGRTHKENITLLKHKTNNQNVSSPIPPDTAKRKHPEDVDDVSAKKMKSNGSDPSRNSIPNDFFDSGTVKKPAKSRHKPKSILKNATVRLPNYGEDDDSEDHDDDDDDDDDSHPAGPESQSSGTPAASGLPSDFFEASTTPASTSTSAETKSLDPSMSEKLPEGFFDDPKQDAHARQVEYKDKMEEEWELFQKAMKEQNTVSEQIMEEDDEQKTLERQVAEVDDQIHRWSQVHALAQKKETIMAEKDAKMEGGADESGSDMDDDLDELVDWRSKAAYKS